MAVARIFGLACGLGGLVLAAVAGITLHARLTDPVRRAERLESAGDLRGASMEWRTAVRAHPRDAHAHLALGRTQLQQSDPVAAERELRLARAYGADRDAVLALLGEALAAQGKNEPLLRELPEEGAGPTLLRLRSTAQLALGDGAGAQATVQAIAAQASASAEASLAAALLARAFGQRDAAEEAAIAAIRADPAQRDALQLRMQLLAERGDRQAALEAADRAVQAAPWSAALRLDRAALAIAQGEDAKAREDVDYVLSRMPRVAGGHYFHALLLARAGRLADASTALGALRPVVDQFPRALYLQALIAANLGNTETALDFAIRYHRRVPSDRDAVRLVARTRLAANQPGPVLPLLQGAVKAGQDDAETLDLLGDAYRALADRGGAVAAYARAVALEPGNATYLTHLGTAAIEQGDRAAGEAALIRAATIAPGDPAAAQALVDAALRAGDSELAAGRLAVLRARVGETAAVAVLDGTIKLARTEYEAARATFAAALTAFPDAIAARVGLGKALVLLGRAGEGEAKLREAVAHRPGDVPALTAYMQYAVRDGDFAAAVPALEAAQRAAPANDLVTAMLSDTLVRAGLAERAAAMLRARRDAAELPSVLLGALARAETASGRAAEALTAYRDQLLATPDDLEARRAELALLQQQGDGPAARRSMQDALAQRPGTLGLLMAAVELERRTAGLDAALSLARRLRDDPAQMPNAALLAGTLLLEAHRPADAREEFTAEFARSPSSALAQRLALAQVAAANPEAAATTLRAWLHAHPADAEANQVLARLDVQAARYDDAAARLEAVLEARPDNAVAMNNLALIYQARGDARARPLAQRAYLRNPSPSTADTLGWILVQQGQPAAAVPLLRNEAMQRSPVPERAYHLAVALDGTGASTEAARLLETVVDRPGTSPAAPRPAACSTASPTGDDGPMTSLRLLALFLIAGTAAARADFIVNGSFENPGTYNFAIYANGSVPGWTSNNNEIEIQNGTVMQSAAGAQLAELNGNTFDTISQTVTGLVVGQSYALGWAYAGRAGSGAQQMNVYFDGFQVGQSTSNGATSWASSTAIVKATAASATVSFAAINVGGSPSVGNLLDSVTLNAYVPEPASAALLAIGTGFVLWRRRRVR